MKIFKLFGCVLLLVSIQATLSYGQVLTDINGTVLRSNPYSHVNGIPYFSGNEWVMGTLTTAGHKVYENVPMKYDLVEDIVYISDGKGNHLKPNENIIQFSLSDADGTKHFFSNGYPKIDKQSELSFYETLVDREIKLLKHTKKVINETLSYGATLKEYNFTEQVSYYIFFEDTMHKISNRKNLLAHPLFGSKKNEIERAIKDMKIDFRKEENLISLIGFINNL